MQIIDLFSGIGGFSLAGYWAGWHTVQFCEIDRYCTELLKLRFPGVPIHDDVKTLTFDTIKGNGLYDATETSIVCGGFPCQPYSLAGKQEGATDERALWPEMYRVIREVKPLWVVAENVRGFLSAGGGGWSSSMRALIWKMSGTMFNRLLFQLAPLGLPTDEIEYGLSPIVDMVPTPRASDYKGASKQTEAKGRNPLTNSCMDAVENGIGDGLKLQPNFVEWLMGFPQGWTDLNSPVRAIDVSVYGRSETA